MSVLLVNGNALQIPLADNSVHCVVTSPPYWGLRDYGISDQLGLEPTPELYVEHMVQVFREVRRVLREDGTLFLNLGDSYASQGGPLKDGGGINDILGGKKETQDYCHSRKSPTGYKAKDLIGIPWLVAFALRADGWWLRSDIIWAKPNPMPESVTDRPTKSHEYLFLLSKSAQYYYDADAIREDSCGDRRGGFIGDRYSKKSVDNFRNDKGSFDTEISLNRNRRTVWTVATQPYAGAKMQADYVGDDGKPYKVSPDCPIHGHLTLSRKSYTAGCDGQQDRRSPRTPGNGSHPAPSQEPSSCASPSRNQQEGGGENSLVQTTESNPDYRNEAHPHVHTSDGETPSHTNHTLREHDDQGYTRGLLLPSSFQIAIDHNNETSRTDPAPLTSSHDNASSQIPSHTQNTSPSDEQSDSVERNPLSSSEASDSSANRNSQTVSHNGHKLREKVLSLSFLPSHDQSYCTCKVVSSDHFATYPPALVEPCIKAGTSEKGCCPACGAPWERVTEVEHTNYRPTKYAVIAAGGAMSGGTDKNFPDTRRQTTGWQPGCACGLEAVSCTVFDPFAGSGTTLMVARSLGRDAIGLDLSYPYLHEQARARLELDKLEAWGNGGKAQAANLSDLPMFAAEVSNDA